MKRRILHVLTQRPLRTGSGITLDALVRLAGRATWEQAALLGVPADDRAVSLGDLRPERLFRVLFASAGDPHGTGTSGEPDLHFPVPGMSDVMPYPSSVWSRLTTAQLAAYRRVWSARCAEAAARWRPDLIHTNHIWLVSALVKDFVREIPVVTTCHATGLRQLELCPHLNEEVVRGCRRNDHFCVLRLDHRIQLARTLDIPEKRITVTGAGYRGDLFHGGADDAARRPQDLLYVGKYSRAKGLPWLLESFQRLAKARPEARLHVVGDGSGPEAEALAETMADLAPAVIQHGTLSQGELAGLMRRCAVCVLPSFYEGVPLVLVEAAACGCRLVATDLPGIREQILPHLGERLTLIKAPRLRGVDRPRPQDLPSFVDHLAAALQRALEAPRPAADAADLTHFTWESVFSRVQEVWTRLLR